MILNKKTTRNVCKKLQSKYSCVKITRLIQKHQKLFFSRSILQYILSFRFICVVQSLQLYRTSLNTCYTSSILLCILKENFQKPTRLIFGLFCSHIFAEVNKNIIKTKKNCFKNFNDVKMILNKKTTRNVCKKLQSKYSCVKITRLNTKALKILVSLLVLFFSAFCPLGLFTLCSHATKFSSLGTSVLVSYIYILKQITYNVQIVL